MMIHDYAQHDHTSAPDYHDHSMMIILSFSNTDYPQEPQF